MEHLKSYSIDEEKNWINTKSIYKIVHPSLEVSGRNIRLICMSFWYKRF